MRFGWLQRRRSSFCFSLGVSVRRSWKLVLALTLGTHGAARLLMRWFCAFGSLVSYELAKR